MGPNGKLNQTMAVAQGEAIQQPTTKRGKTSSRDATPPDHRNAQSPSPVLVGGMNPSALGSPSLMENN